MNTVHLNLSHLWLARLIGTLCCAMMCGPLGAAAAKAPTDPADTAILAARSAFERGDRVRLDAAASTLGAHVLYPYVAYWQLKLKLDTARDDEVRGYLERWPATPLADRLRVDWLKSLGRHGMWPQFAIDYPPPGDEDIELACYGAQYRRQRDGDAALVTAKPLWFNGQATPESCDPVFSALIASDDLTLGDRRARFRLAVEAGNIRLAQSIAAGMPGDSRTTAREFAPVDRDPARALLKGEFRWKQPSGRDLALYALERAARTDATLVREAWVRQRVNLPEADRRYGNARLAYHAARQLAPEANEWYREADGATLSDTEHAWRARAALRASAWPDVLAAIDAMPPAIAQETSWRYWRARALHAAGRVDEARALNGAISSDREFYGILAAEALGSVAAVPAKAELRNPDEAAVKVFGARPGVARAVKLAQLDMRPEMLREWAYAVRGQDDEALLAASEFAHRQGMYDRSISAAERASGSFDPGLRYPMPYRDAFAAAAREHAIDEAILFGVARQESRFIASIVSSAGAVGLMQLMPPTAIWVARQIGKRDYRPAQIGEIDLNTRFGAFYFKYWLERLEGQPALAAAAYNAGPNRAQAWRTGAPLEGAVWVETIPFNETRDYVKKVLANSMHYARLMNQPYVPLTTRLGTVGPRTNGNGALATTGQ